jgi:FixJ family two-component response regulator
MVVADISLCDRLEARIRALGWQIEAFASAEQLLSSPAALGPSCLVLDVTLPGLNGYDLQRRVAADRAGMPIILVTVRGEVLMTVHASNGGFTRSISTPPVDDGLLNTIRRAVDWSETALRHAGRAMRRAAAVGEADEDPAIGWIERG